MRLAVKKPSEWLRLLCHDWSLENEAIVAETDLRFLHYKSYLKGLLTSQLLCRLSISSRPRGGGQEFSEPAPVDFWKTLGVEDEFDRAHIVANVERFYSLYNIRGGVSDGLPSSPPPLNAPGYNILPDSLYHAAAAVSVSGTNTMVPPVDPNNIAMGMPKKTETLVYSTKTRRATDPAIGEQRRIKAEMREREREAYAARRAEEKAAQLASREERLQHKLAMRKQREESAQQQKEAALRRAADLVLSDRVPDEISRAGYKVASFAPSPAAVELGIAMANPSSNPTIPPKKGRSSIVISTASDLDQIVTHANNLWAKYNSIAKENNTKVNWIVVSKELGIHVKVREKYARMHARAKARGFDFVNWGSCRIKDYPQYFLDPLGPAPLAAGSSVEEAGKPPPEAAVQPQNSSVPPALGVSSQQREASSNYPPLYQAGPTDQNPPTLSAETAEVIGDRSLGLDGTVVGEVLPEVSGDEELKSGSAPTNDDIHSSGDTAEV
jgi:hypothetical protein